VDIQHHLQQYANPECQHHTITNDVLLQEMNICDHDCDYIALLLSHQASESSLLPLLAFHDEIPFSKVASIEICLNSGN
jgi:hypothetical protein